ncbi:hypothetical protein [Streptomyces sp. NRRL S-340]|uniref:hypothetical protein n=1 Tax=Streptomyces sp. NRRL S-340 TaxID=1463901 RepID=UPI00068D3D4B|nr:hypothetical protein [Streptomyces sp. NRRL S-340]
MADEQYRWLDRDTAERLLRGEPPDTADVTVRDQAQRLADVLRTLSAAPAVPPSDAAAELPGEAAALAAFRKVRAERADARAGQAVAASAEAARRHGAGPAADAGLVRLAPHTSRNGQRANPVRSRRPGPRLGRPVRLALSATLAAGALGGVAAAATTGVLPTPFGGDEPAPAASVSPSATSARPSPPFAGSGEGSGDGSGAPTPGGAGVTAGPSAGDASATDRDGDGAAGHGSPAAGDGDRTGQGGQGGRWGRLSAACRDLRDGKVLDTGRKHVLDGAAGGSSRVWTYCKGVLKTAGGQGSGQGSGTGQGGSGSGGQNGQGDHDGQGGKGDHQGRGDGKGGRGGDDDAGHADGGPSGGGLPGGGRPEGVRPREGVLPRSSAVPSPPAKAASPRPSAHV